MYWNLQTLFILHWNNHALLEAYTSPTQPIFSIPIVCDLGMEYHLQYLTHPHNLKITQEVHHHQDFLYIHHILTMLQGGNNLHRLVQALTSLCDNQPQGPQNGAFRFGAGLSQPSSEESGEALPFL